MQMEHENNPEDMERVLG